MENIKKIELSFPGKGSGQYNTGETVWGLARNNEISIPDDAIALRLNENLRDINLPLMESGEIEFISSSSDEGAEIYRHSTSHLMAQAIKQLYPEAKIAIGPSIENGFYYDIDMEKSLTTEDLEAVTRAMKKLVKKKLPVKREEMPREKAIDMFRDMGEDYKVELLNEIADDEVAVYRQGDFVDLCRGPHLANTRYIKNFKLLSLAGAYWRGSEDNKMLQRIYGTAFPLKEQLEDYLKFLEEAEKRDHRKIGKELDLFSFHPEAPGFPFWHHKGLVILNEIIEYWREIHLKKGYKEIKTPIILNEELWRRSGHWDHYSENMYFTKIDKKDFAVKPMNCPGGLLVFKEKLYSYRDMPLKVAELGLVHRHEKSGVLHGLFRVRQFTQDDAHVYCTEEQMLQEIINIINLVIEIYTAFGFEKYRIEISTKPEKSIGSDEIWEHSEKALAEAMKIVNLPYKINEGDGAFYGPKIDFHIKDSIGREWQCGTIQVDFSMPERFNLEYVTSEGTKARPVMIHRAILGSLERFVGNLIEEYAGDFPLWLAPVQVNVVPISEKHFDYAESILKRLEENRIRCVIDKRNEKVGKKIRESELQKIPFMLIVGDNEIENNTVSIRLRKGKEEKDKNLEEFIKNINRLHVNRVIKR